MKAKPRFYDGPRMSDLAGEGEAAWVLSRLEEDDRAGRTVLGFQGWTHSPGRLLRRKDLLLRLHGLRDQGTALSLQVSITGLGATLLEPGIGATDEEFGALMELRRVLGAGWETFCVRIDPLQSFRDGRGEVLSNLPIAPGLFEKAARLGIRRFRTSLVQFEKYKHKIEPRLRKRGLTFAPADPTDVEEACRAMAEAAKRFGAELRSCASPLPRVDNGACFDPAQLRTLCTHPMREADPVWKPDRPVAPREGCACAFPGEARLMKIPARTPCTGGCAVCYARP
ncbi:MAG: DUF1848 family protein [Planctomycetota bacterium]|jgi:hypothetical protein